MSAQLADAAASRNRFTAHLDLPAGVTVSIHAPTMTDLAFVVARVQGDPAVSANDSKPVAATPVAQKPAATPAPTAAPAAAGNAPASTAPAASAPAAAGGSAVTYDDVKARVLALSKVSRDVCLATLGAFTGVNGQPVDHGNKLQLADYAAFIAAADAKLGAAK